MVGGSESWEQNNYGMELCLDGGVRGCEMSVWVAADQGSG